MAKQVKKTPFDLEYEKAKDRYDYPFKKAEAAGVPREEILAEVKANRPEKWSYRVKRGVGLDPSRGLVSGVVNEIGAGMASASRKKQRENEGKDIWDTIAEAPGKAYKTTPGAIAVDSIGKAISRIAPSSDKSLLGKYTPPSLAKGESHARAGIEDVVGESMEGMTTPKGLATAGGFLIPGVNVAVGAAVLPEMITGAWESGVKGARDLAKGNVRGGTKGLANAAVQGLMAKGLVGHGKAKVEAAKVAKEVEANKVIEARANELSEMAKGRAAGEYQIAREDVLADKVKTGVQRDIAKAREDVLREKAERGVQRDMEKARQDVRENPYPVDIAESVAPIELPERGVIRLPGRVPRRVIIRKPGEVEVVPTKVDVSDAIFPRPRDIEVPGTRGIAETMDAQPYRAPRRMIPEGQKTGPWEGFTEPDISYLQDRGALPKPPPKVKPYTTWDAVQDIIKEIGLSEKLDKGYTGELRELRKDGVKGMYAGAHEQVVNAPGGKIVRRAGTADRLRERLVEEGLIPENATLAEAWEFVRNERFRHHEGKSAPYEGSSNFEKVIEREHYELGERLAEAEREAAKPKPPETWAEERDILAEERMDVADTVGDTSFDVADTMKATFTKEAATEAIKPKRRSKAAREAEELAQADDIEALQKALDEKKARREELVKQGRYGYQLRMPDKAIKIASRKLDAARQRRLHLEEIAKQRGIAEKEIAAMTNKELAKAAVKEIVPTVGGQIETRSVYEQARQRAIQREIAKRAGKAVGERAPMAAGATAAATKVAPSPQPTTAPSPLAATTDVAHKVLSEKELAQQKDLAGKFGTTKIDRTRGLEELVRNQKGDLQKIHKETQDKMYAAQKGFAHTQMVERKAMLANLKKIGIKVNTANMRRVQELGEKTKTFEQIVKEVGPKRAQQIVEADKMFRTTYNRFINEINRVRKENGISAIKPREDYYRHVVEMGGDSIGGIADAMALDPTLTYGHGGKSSILKKRTANMKHEVNALNGFLDYLPQYALETNLKPFSHYAKGALNDITNMVGGKESTALHNTRSFYEGMVRDAAREKSALDTSVEGAVSQIGGKAGLKTYIGMKKIGSNVIRNTVAKFSPIITNFAAYANAAGEIGVLDAARGFARTMMEMTKKTKTSDKGYFVPERFESRANRKANTKFWKRNSPLAGAFEIADQSFITRPVWNCMYEKGLRLKEADPVKYADAETGKIVGARSIMDRPEYYNSSIGRQLTPFTLEVNNYYRQVKGYLKGKKGGQKSAASAAWKLTKMMAASHLINMMLEEITGNPVLFDPYQAMIEAAEKDDPVEAFGRIASEALSILPSASMGMQLVPQQHRRALFGRSDPGRYGVVQTKPFRSAGKLIKGAYRAATDGKPVEGKMNAAIDLFGSLVPKLPGGQIKATGQGFNVLANDGEFMWGAVPVQVDTSDPAELLRLLILGPYATNAFKEIANQKQ